MPQMFFKEVWTPLRFFGIRFFRELGSRLMYVKVGSSKRRPLRKKTPRTGAGS